MSKLIKITVVTNDEKPNGENDGASDGEMELTQGAALTLMPVLLKNGLMDGSFCGGRGDCGRCVVQFLKGVPLPTGLERSCLEPEELRQGYRLACVTRPKTDCTVRVVGAQEVKTPIVTEAAKIGADIIANTNMQEMDSGKENACYIAAVDLGTTTIAMQLKDAATGAVADAYCEMNPQRKYGTDVLARIQASVEGQGEELRRLVCGVILRGLRQFARNLQKEAGEGTLSDRLIPVNEKGNAGKILGMCIAGNTVMEHLLLGTDVSSLGKAPFVPVEKGLQSITAAHLFAGMEEWSEDLRMADGGALFDMPVYIAPCMSAFVGGDIVAGLYALGLLPARQAENGERQAVLFIDLGTNGEMVITDGQRMIVTATAAGPAFEGDGTMMGTDRIALTAQLLQRGILDETGLMEEPYFTEGVRIEDAGEVTAADGQIKNDCYFKQKDVRSLQMAKAAVRAGVEILWDEMGRPEIEKVFLAGGFGYYLDVEAAVAVGLLPSHMRGRVRAAGNTSLAGAYEMGRDLCGKRLDAASLEERTHLAESINLADTERFEGLYLKYMNLGEN